MNSMPLEKQVSQALLEDLDADVATDHFIPENRLGRARLLANEDLILSGTKPFSEVWHQVDPQVLVKWVHPDGHFIWRGQTVCTLQGSLKSLLKGARTALNFLGPLSGVASLTRCYVQQVEHTRCRILDTRHITPLWRDLKKEAVRHGGGQNHDVHPHQTLLIQNHHLKAIDGRIQALQQLRTQTELPLKVECLTLEDIHRAVELQAENILLNNFSDIDLKNVLHLIPASIHKEVSGNVELARVRKVAEMGVDFIGVSALTHSAPAADFYMEFEI